MLKMNSVYRGLFFIILSVKCGMMVIRTHLENCDNGPQQGVKVLPVWHCVSSLRLQTELTAKDVHPQDTATGHVP